jgi:hypothetical protein
MKVFRSLLLATSLMTVPAWAAADPVTITFDNPQCQSVGGNHYVSTCFAGAGVVITAFYQTQSAPLFTMKPAADAVSHPNVAQGAPDLGLFDVQLSFVMPGMPLVPAVTNFVAFYVTTSERGQDPWGVTLYGANGQRLAPTTLGFANGLATFTRPTADIQKVIFGTGTINQGIDNLQFNTPTAAPPVPEPATVLLLAGGLAAIIRRRQIEM